MTTRLFRQDLPLHTRPGGRDLLASRLEALGEEIKAMATRAHVLDALIDLQDRNTRSTKIFDLPHRDTPRHFRLLMSGLRVARHGRRLQA